MSNNRYVRLTKGVNDRGILVKPEEVLERIDSEKDYYVSTYYYNEEQYKQFQQTKTVKGIRDVTSDQVWFDFDSKDDLSLAQNDVKVLLERVKKYADPKSAEVYFSGNKGFTVILKLNKFLNPKQIEYLALEKFGKDLKTLDASLYDSAQILRVPGTKHQVSGLYKIPLTTKEIQSLTPDEIKKKASSLDQISDEFDWKPMDLSEELLDIPETKAEVPVQSEFSIENKPRYWKTTKWAIAQGYFEPGERHEAMMVLAATCRGMNYDKITTYYICKASLDKHMQRTGREDKFSKEELWENIIENSVFSDEWQGGQYGDEHPLIKKIAARLNISLAKDNSITKIDETFALFKDYANNIDKLTIRSGIPALDAKLRMTVGMSVGIVASPGVGKCLGKDTPILMYDGSIKLVQNIRPGDQIMGDDSTVRNVLSICSGQEQLYKIHQENGDSYIVNESHILSLKGGASLGHKARIKKYNYGTIHDIELLKYLNGSKKQLKYLKGYKVPVDFAKKETVLDPYFLGLWLGDGTSTKPEITIGKKDIEQFSYLKAYANQLSLSYRIIQDRKCYRFSFRKLKRNKGKSIIAKNIPENKVIPKEYLINSKENRLKLLAGLIDSDGYLGKGNYYEIVQKNKELATQIVFLCRSLGFRTTLRECTKYCYYKGEKRTGTYYRIFFTSENLKEIPIRIDRKKPRNIDKQRYSDLTKIKVEKLEIGQYFGFEIDGNKRFLLGDFTVTHNTSIALQILNSMSKRGEKCIFFSYDMYHALVYQKLVQKHLGIPSDEIFRKFKEKNSQFEQMVHERIQQEYKNVDFCFQSGQSIQDIIETIRESEQKSGQKVRLIVLDYNELIMTDYSDPTQSSSYVAQKLREIANVEQLCVVSLFQPSKMSGGPSDDIKSYRSAKGSSAIEQSVSAMLGISRPGFDPRNPEGDKFMTINGLKNRMGSLFSLDLHWDGLRGTVRELTSEEKDHLRQIREAKETKSGDWE